MTLNQVAGVLPAIVFPVATAIQLVRILRDRSAAGVSVSTWLLFGFANLGMYVYAERYAEWQAILGMLVTAVVDFAIVALVLCGYGRPVEPAADLPKARSGPAPSRQRSPLAGQPGRVGTLPTPPTA